MLEASARRGLAFLLGTLLVILLVQFLVERREQQQLAPCFACAFLKPGPGAESLLVGAKLDLNRAVKRDLQVLPGVGHTLAERILFYREQRGKFISPGQLRLVPGVGQKKYLAVAPYLSAGVAPND